MKRLTGVTAVFGVSILVVWAIFQLFAVSSPKNDNTHLKIQPANNEIMKTINTGNEAVVPVTGDKARTIAPVFDTSGAVVSDPSGTVLNTAPSGNMAIPVTGADKNVAPVFDTNGAVVSDPSGTILNTSHP